MKPLAIYVGGSTLTSTRPGLSIAGPSPQGTLYTPTLDLEYLVLGFPVTLNAMPVSPEGLPTPAVITRAVLQTSKIPYLVVDAGAYYGLKVPHVRLPSARHGNDIAVSEALPPGISKRLFYEGEALGRAIGRGHDLVLIGESMPGGTTVTAAIMTAFGYDGVSLVSSASPDNPKDLKRGVVRSAVLRVKGPMDPFSVIDAVGDPVHVTIAGIAKGVISEGAHVVLAGGTQMGAVLAIMG
ncbi:MAG: nicotinate-nucleotide--dimethylbenzimidazole phosphoribosyltransferase, partial [Acidilobus sp.]